MGEITRIFVIFISMALTNGAPNYLGFNPQMFPMANQLPFACGNPYYRDLRQIFLCNYYLGLQMQNGLNNGYRLPPGINGPFSPNPYVMSPGNFPFNYMDGGYNGGLDFFKETDDDVKDQKDSYRTYDELDTLLKLARDKNSHEDIPEKLSLKDKDPKKQILELILPENIEAIEGILRLLLSFKKQNNNDASRPAIQKTYDSDKPDDVKNLQSTKDIVLENDGSNMNMPRIPERNLLLNKNTKKSQDLKTNKIV